MFLDDSKNGSDQSEAISALTSTNQTAPHCSFLPASQGQRPLNEFETKLYFTKCQGEVKKNI
jgi:hypothetical protein